jgi:ABC-type uncharacterized transport system permease subunit
MRYPREIFEGTWAAPLARFFTYAVPVLLVINVPASVMVRSLDPGFVAFTLVATVLLALGSRAFFRRALRRYSQSESAGSSACTEGQLRLGIGARWSREEVDQNPEKNARGM